jgi:hypothetical protein
MPYTMIEGDQAPRGPEASGVPGYLYNHGGLNNQKMALIGLMLSGIRDKQPINLPYIYNRDQRTDQEYVVRIEEIFEIDRVFDFAERHDLTILTQCPSGERGGWVYFEDFHKFVSGAPDRHSLETALDAVNSLKPRITTHPAFLQLRDFVRANLGITMVVQLRIEADWRTHSASLREVIGDSEDNGIGFMQILGKVKRTFPDLGLIYATSDEQSMPASKQEIRTLSRDAYGIEILWKSDLLPAPLIGQLTPLDLSMIDYEIAKASPRFVGLTSSTFSNMACLEKFAATRNHVKGHYIYNCLGDVVQERQDNGCASYAQGAVLPSRTEALLAQVA